MSIRQLRSLCNPSRLPHHRRWTELSLSLAQFAGEQITLTLRTDVGEHGIAHFAWALWGDPEIVVDGATVHRLANPGAAETGQALPLPPPRNGHSTLVAPPSPAGSVGAR